MKITKDKTEKQKNRKTEKQRKQKRPGDIIHKAKRFLCFCLLQYSNNSNNSNILLLGGRKADEDEMENALPAHEIAAEKGAPK